MKHLKEPTYIYWALLVVFVCLASLAPNAHAKATPEELFASGFKFASEDNFKKAQKNFKIKAAGLFREDLASDMNPSRPQWGICMGPNNGLARFEIKWP